MCRPVTVLAKALILVIKRARLGSGGEVIGGCRVAVIAGLVCHDDNGYKGGLAVSPYVCPSLVYGGALRTAARSASERGDCRGSLAVTVAST